MLWRKEKQEETERTADLDDVLTDREESSQPTSPSSDKSQANAPQKRWYRRLNPLKSSVVPPVPDKRGASREFNAGFLSRLVFNWITPLMHVGYQRPLEPNDIWLVNPNRSIDTLEKQFSIAFQEHVKKGSRSPLLRALYSTFKREFLIGGCCQLLMTITSTMSPFVLKFLVAFATDAYNARHYGSSEPSLSYGVGLVIIITVLQIVMTLSINTNLYMGMMVGGQARAVLMSAIFSKALRLSGRAKAGGLAPTPPSHVEAGSDEEKKWYRKALPKTPKRSRGGPKGTSEAIGWSNGRIVNLMSTDTWRIDQACGFFHITWSSPLNVIITMVLLLVNLSYSALPGVGLLLLSSPVLARAVQSLFKRRSAINKITDQRVSLTQEILQGIRFVKLFGWEKSFLRRVDSIREREIRSIQLLLATRDAITAISMALPVFASMVSFITYSLTSHVLTPAPIFSSLSLFNGLRMPLNMLPMALGQTIDAYASTKRIQEFFLAEEIDDDVDYDYENKNAIVVREAEFSWEQTQDLANEDENSRHAVHGATLQNTTSSKEPFKIPRFSLSLGRSELIGVIGAVGSGKSSLLAALAGEMKRTAGSMTFGGSRAFCPQYAWIQNASVRDNIIFGRDFDRNWYDKVTDACALTQDFHMLPDGDRTEIGERGITVSGGQKQRINIARAIYSDAEVVLMDDPLSAVDAHVGRHIMDKAICGLLAHKCRILATHQLHVLHRCDRIIWLDGGQIRAMGTFDHLMAEVEDFAQLMALTSVNTNDEKRSNDGDEEELEEKEELTKAPTAKDASALMQAEERAVKAVSWDVYGAYIRASGTILNAPLVIALLIGAQGGNTLSGLWLSWWTAEHFSLKMKTWIGIYAGLGGAQAVFMFLFAVSLTVFGTRASKSMFKRAMTQVLRAPMSFFDTTPLGRITNRFSKDIDVMDNSLTESFRMYFITLGMIISTMILILSYYYYFVAALAPLIVIFLFAADYYRSSAREIKRHEAILRSHVFAKFSEAVYGTSTIRAYGLGNTFVQRIRQTIDDFDGAYFLTFANQRWLSLRLDAIAIILIFILGMLVVTSRFSVSPSSGGLVLSYMLSIMGSFQMAIRQIAEVENDMNNTERIHYYGTQLEEEAPLRIGEVPVAWPQTGEINFDRVQMRYRTGLPPVLRDISFTVKGGERLGIVGRTGAGKSSIINTLFRMVEISSGSITIDGVNISKIGLHDIRSRLAIIPQDPTLFKGTIRSNLDPFNEHTDPELWSALRQAYLIGDEKDGLGLDSVVEEEGLNFSLGQRQLMALARALVRNSKIIVCDEATSSVDFATDQKVQSTMEAFQGKTLLCIAHRLRTIIGYDRICVMERGTVAELGPPLELFDRDGIFRSMCEKGGISRGDILEKTVMRSLHR